MSDSTGATKSLQQMYLVSKVYNIDVMSQYGCDANRRCRGWYIRYTRKGNSRETHCSGVRERRGNKVVLMQSQVPGEGRISVSFASHQIEG